MGKKETTAPAITMPPICPYCGDPATFLRSSAALYHGRDYGPLWTCLKNGCQAWVGCHPDTDLPLGRLANAELRSAKGLAHAAFDQLWQAKMKRDGCGKSAARRAGYRWLADQLGIDPATCHVGMMDVETCRRVVEVCAPYQRRSA